ncbi:MAG: ATP-grasp domain-containing protein [Candidatus Thorarchaeota archaeon]
MTLQSSILDGKNVGVIGFNARPIAASLRRQGARTFVSDYWGDSDLSDVSDECITILSPVPGIRQRQPLDLPIHQSLIDNFSVLTKDVDLDYVYIGSGFDDHSESLIPFFKSGILVGSSPEAMVRSRDFSILSRMLKKLDIKVPQRELIQTSDSLWKKSAAMKFPYLVRPQYSGGGGGIRFVHNEKDLQKIADSIFNEDVESSYLLQQYIRGRDLSCSTLSDGRNASPLSVQGQLIGMPSAGKNCGFSYCGNYYPSGVSSQIEAKIREVCERMAEKLGLKGSVGFDFIVDDSDTIWLMEINPRIQGTLEMLELSSNISITDLHVRAFLGELPQDEFSFSPSVKMIVYSRKNGRVPDLSGFPNTFDRTPEAVGVDMGDPICTVINTGESLSDAYQKTIITANEIQLVIH